MVVRHPVHEISVAAAAAPVGIVPGLPRMSLRVLGRAPETSLRRVRSGHRAAAGVLPLWRCTSLYQRKNS